MNPFDEIADQSKRWALVEDGIDVSYEADFLTSEDADRLFAALKKEITWKRHVIQTAGGPKTVPRMISWHADEGLTYSYSGLTHPWKAWTPALSEVRGRLASHLGVEFNGVLANFYEDERDSVSPHADDESDMEEGAPIAAVSFGETRDFVLKHMVTGARHAIPVGHGSLLVMAGETQQKARHSIPKMKRSCGPRISLTFRRTLRGED